MPKDYGTLCGECLRKEWKKDVKEMEPAAVWIPVLGTIALIGWFITGMQDYLLVVIALIMLPCGFLVLYVFVEWLRHKPRATGARPK